MDDMEMMQQALLVTTIIRRKLCTTYILNRYHREKSLVYRVLHVDSIEPSAAVGVESCRQSVLPCEESSLPDLVVRIVVHKRALPPWRPRLTATN